MAGGRPPQTSPFVHAPSESRPPRAHCHGWQDRARAGQYRSNDPEPHGGVMENMTTLDSYITLGRSGLRVSPLTLGTMTFGEDWGWSASPETSEAILSKYLDRGGNVVDTANVYTNGHSEKIVGDFFAARPGLRERVVLSTKFFANLYPGDPNGGGGGRKALIAQLEESLRRLQTDYVDLYWLHNWDRRAPIEETLRALDDLVAAGKVRYVGLSDVPAWLAAQAQTTPPPPGRARCAGPDDRSVTRLDARHRLAARVLAAGAHARRRATADGASAWHRG